MTMDLSIEFQIILGSTQTILTADLGMTRVAAKFVPKLLSENQMENGKQNAINLLKCAESNENFLKSIGNIW